MDPVVELAPLVRDALAFVRDELTTRTPVLDAGYREIAPGAGDWVARCVLPHHEHELLWFRVHVARQPDRRLWVAGDLGTSYLPDDDPGPRVGLVTGQHRPGLCQDPGLREHGRGRLDRVQTVRNEEKLDYWASLLAGAATADRPSPTDRDQMMETLDGLRPEHLRLLHVIATTDEPPPGLYMAVWARLSTGRCLTYRTTRRGDGGTS